MRPGGADEPQVQRLTVATTFRAYEGFSGRPGDPFDRLPVAPPKSFDLGRTLPPELTKGMERDDGAFGSVLWAGRRVLVGLYAAEGSSLRMPVLCVDADGDGTFEGVGEQRRVRGRASARGQTWQADLTVNGVPAVLAVERTSVSRRLLRLEGGRGGGAHALPIVGPPPGGVLDPTGRPVALLAGLRVGGKDVLVGIADGGTGAGAGPRIGVDADGDRRLDAEDEWQAASALEASATEQVAVFRDLAVGGERVTLRYVLKPERTHATLSPPGALRGTATLAGHTMALFLFDRDLDGAYTSAEDLWWFGSLERLARLHELCVETLIEGDEPAFLGGAPWRLRIVEADGTAHLAYDATAGTISAYLARRHARVEAAWAPRLAAESDAFRAANGIDAARPRAPVALPWMFATDLSEALARAQVEGKPVFAVFEADWCQWCHRLDLHTFQDAEVAEALSRFVCVRLPYDFLTGGEYERYGGRGLPLLLFLDASGRLLERTPHDPCDPCRGALLGSFEAPQVFVGRVRSELATWEALQKR